MTQMTCRCQKQWPAAAMRLNLERNSWFSEKLSEIASISEKDEMGKLWWVHT